MLRNTIFLAFGFLLLQNILHAQYKVLDLPKCCEEFYIRLEVDDELLSQCGGNKNKPWIVYSDRGDDFGQRYYVVQEKGNQVLLVSASSLEGDKLINPKEVGWKNKTELLVHYSAELLKDGIIHKKCVVLNKEEIIQDIIAGKLKESDIPLFKGPSDLTPMDSVPLYFIYFVYKSEKGRYLIGSDYKFLQENPFKNQIFGWVDTNRVYLYNTRICFEPNWEPSAVKERRCNPQFEATVFEYREDAEKAKLTGSMQWEEPQHYYLFSSDYVSDSSVLKKRIVNLCNAPDEEAENFLEEEYLPGAKFRFPLVGVINDNVFQLGCTGRLEDQDVQFDQQVCQKLQDSKRNLNVTFIIDQNVRDTRAGFVLETINRSYADFEKQYGACYFPRPEIGEKNKPLGNNYGIIRDYFLNYKPGPYPITDDNCLKTLNYILMDEEELDLQKTNLIILLNNSDVPQLSEKTYQQIINNLIKKNCYIIAFDYKPGSGLITQLQDILLKTANAYAARYAPNSKPFWAPGNNYLYLKDAGILAMVSEKNATLNNAKVVEGYMNDAQVKIITTIDQAINDICASVGNSRKTEDPLKKTLREIAQVDIVIQQPIRALFEGYSVIQLPIEGCDKPMWKAEVLMTEGELESLLSLMGKFTTVKDNTYDQSNKIFELWKELANRFVGDQLSEERLLDLNPMQVLNKIVRSPFGYSDNGIALKNFRLRDIKDKDPAVIKLYGDYVAYVTQCYKDLSKILEQKTLEFKNSRDENSTISYYWIPIDKLP